MAELLDSFARPLRDLRISVTDRCNFRCTYCMPREVFGPDHAFLPRAEILSFEEITRVARIVVGLGVEKIRLTGGEPLLRRDLPELVKMLSAIPGVRDLALTTNGVLLPDLALPLRQAGLGRVTVSLDALDGPTFRAMSDTTLDPERVLAGIEAARLAGLSPLKINTVIQRGVNEHAIAELAARFDRPGFVLRFIEFMDVGETNGWRRDRVVPASEIVAQLDQLGLEPLAPARRGEVARRYRTRAGAEIGVISSVTQPFCRDCTRLRLTADGHLHTCLFSSGGHDLRPLLRGAADDETIAAFFRRLWSARTDRYSELRAAGGAGRKEEMSVLGG